MDGSIPGVINLMNLFVTMQKVIVKEQQKLEVILHGKSYYGCYDMAGNVWEWTGSWYDENEKESVLHGGSWRDDSRGCRCAYRLRIGPDYRYNNIGFRCARTLTL